jgi:hypothetical protein
MDFFRRMQVGVIWRFRITIGNRKELGNKVDYVVEALLPFSSSLTGHDIRSSGNVRYFLRHLLFYCRRFFLTITRLLKKRLSNNKYSLPKERAGAKKQNHPENNKFLINETSGISCLT